MREFTCSKSARLSKYLADNFSELSYGNFRKLLRDKDIKINGKRVKDDVQVYSGDEIVVYFNETKAKTLFEIVYEDKNILIVNKFQGMTSDELFEKLKVVDGAPRELYYIHRLDRNTEGLIVFAKTSECAKLLTDGFKERAFEKYYLADAYGKMPKTEDTLTAYLVKDAENGKVRIFDKPVKDSSKIITKYKVLGYENGISKLEVELVTGKTHQIRAHLAYIGHFIIGDGKYGVESVNKKYSQSKQVLKAYKMVFHFPTASQLGYLEGKTFTI